MIDISSPKDRLIIIIMVVMASFALFTVIIGKGFMRRIFRPKIENNNAGSVVFQRLTGLVLFGVLPMLTVWFWFRGSIEQYGFNWPKYNYVLYVVIGLAFVLPVVNYFNSKRSDTIKMYPQIRNLNWSPGLFLMNCITWAMYLFAYELMFRGVLLFGALETMGVYYAIALNTVIYSIYHFPKGKKESIASIPFGIVLCLIAVETDSFFYPFLLHLTLALSNDGFSLRAHPDMKLSFRRKV